MLTALAPLAASTASISGQRRSLRPERASNDHDVAPLLSIDDSIDDGFVDDNIESRGQKLHQHKIKLPKGADDSNNNSTDDEEATKKGPLKLFEHVDFSVGSHFKGWANLTLTDAHHKGSNDVELQFITGDDAFVDDQEQDEDGGDLTQNSFEAGQFPNNRFCGYTFDNAVDTHCHTPTSCQFQRCPSGMTCYVLSEGVMSWCAEENKEDGDEIVSDETGAVDDGAQDASEEEGALQQNDAEMGSSEPTEGWSEMPVEKPSVVSWYIEEKSCASFFYSSSIHWHLNLDTSI